MTDILLQKDTDTVKEALDLLNQAGWAKKWSSQPYVSRRTVSPPLQCEVLGKIHSNINYIDKITN